MAIVASDLHGNLSKVKRFLEYLPDIEHVFAGDILDSRVPHSVEEQTEALKLLINSPAILLWGNHEQNYWTPPRMCSGYQSDGAGTYTHILSENKSRFKNAHLADGYIITHAGIHNRLEVPSKVTTCVSRLNYNKVTNMNAIGYSRGGDRPSGGIFWYDYKHDYDKLSQKFNQVFGHCPSKFPWEDRQEGYHHVCVNTSEQKENFWVFDTSTQQLVEL